MPEIPARIDRESFYKEWLTDYLIRKPVLLSLRQQEWVNTLPQDYSSYIAEYYPEGIAEVYDELQPALEIIEASHAAGETWEQFDKRQRLAWENADKPCDYENEWSCCSITWEEIGTEYQEMMIAGPNPDYPDIPLRAYISLEIKGLDREEALQVVKGYLFA